MTRTVFSIPRCVRSEEPLEAIKKRKGRGGSDDDLEEILMMASGDDNEMLDPYTPTIYLNGEVNDKMVEGFRNAVRDLEFVRKSDIALVMIASPGGFLMSCFEILNIMKASKINFITYCVSHAYSAAAVILSAGGEGRRFMAPMSNAMIHQVSAGTAGHIEEMRGEIRNLEKMNEMLMTELAKNCGISLKQLLDRISATGTTDLNLTPQEAKELGLVDEVAYVSLVQAKAYQLEIITEDEDTPEKVPEKTAPAKPSSKPAKKATPKRKPTKKTSK
jgi:ATP-dependent Clp protease protease subunit